MLSLSTFGGCALLDESRHEAIAVGQRRPLAMLALLAAAGEGGMSRERLASLLWPEAEGERGRRSLAQAVYQVRRLTGEEELLVGAPELRLNSAVIHTDRADFERALREGRLADAVDLYRGPFLDGFTVPGVDAFERWVDGERRDCERRCAEAVRALVTGARRAKDPARAVAWARRLAALDPLDSSAALLLIESLDEAGDPAGALRAAQIHEALLADQLDLALPEPIRARLAALRDRPAPSHAGPSDGVRAPQPVESASNGATNGAADGAADGTADGVSAGQSPIARAASPSQPAPGSAPVARRLPGTLPSPPRIAWLVGALVIAAVSLGAGMVIGRGMGAPRTIPVAPTPNDGVVAVLPFATDASAGATVGNEIAAQLGRAFAGDIGPRALDPGLVTDAVRDEGTSADVSRSRAGARALAERLGASEVIMGRVSGTPENLTVTATLLGVRSKDQQAAAEAHGRADNLPKLVNELAAQLLAERELDDERARAFADVALPPLRTFLRAESAFRDERFEEAVRLYTKALDDDSTFAPAALGLAAAADRFNASEQHDRGLALAWAARERLGERDRAFLVALAGPRYPEPSTAEEQVAAWERVVTLAGDRASVWVELGERFFYDGAALGVRGAETRATNAFRRALAIDPSNAPALRHLIEIASRARDTTALDALAADAQLSRAGARIPGYIRWRIATARGDSAALRRLRAEYPSLLTSSLRAIAMASQHDVVALDDGALALRTLGARVALGSEQLDLLMARHSLALNTGRVQEALRITQELEEAQPASRAHLRLRVLDALYSDGDSVAARNAADALARTADAPADTTDRGRALQLADECVLAQWRATRESTNPSSVAATRAAVQEMRRTELPRTPVPVGANPRACADLVEATLSVALALPDARERVARLEVMTLAGPALSDARTYGAIVVARLAEAMGDRPRALAAIRRRGYLKGWPRYLSTALRMEAQLADAVAARDVAVDARRRYAVFRGEGVPPVAADARTSAPARDP